MSQWIKRQGIMLCYPFEEKRLTKWNYPFLVQPKLDGERMRAIFDDKGNVTLLSSEENEILSLPHISEELTNSGLMNVELDGEAYIHGEPFETIHSIVSRKVNIHPDYWRVNYHIFDMMSDKPQLERLGDLADFFNKDILKLPIMELVPTYPCFSLKEIMDKLQEFKELKFEGIIVRNAFASYVRKRSVHMMKFKPKKSDYYRILGYKEEIDKDGNPKGRLGAFICCGEDGTEFSVGSGCALTHNNRQNFWDNREDLIGAYCHIEYQHITPGRGVPRFPVLLEVIEEEDMVWSN